MNNYVSVREIYSRLLIHPMLENKLTLDQVIIYTQDFIRIMGLPIEFLEKSAIIEPEANRAMLPRVKKLIDMAQTHFI